MSSSEPIRDLNEALKSLLYRERETEIRRMHWKSHSGLLSNALNADTFDKWNPTAHELLQVKYKVKTNYKLYKRWPDILNLVKTFMEK